MLTYTKNNNYITITFETESVICPSKVLSLIIMKDLKFKDIKPERIKPAHQVLKTLHKICTNKVYNEIFWELDGGYAPSYQIQYRVPLTNKRIERNHYTKVMKEMKSTGIALVVPDKVSSRPHKAYDKRPGKGNEIKSTTLNTLNRNLLFQVSTFLIEVNKT